MGNNVVTKKSYLIILLLCVIVVLVVAVFLLTKTSNKNESSENQMDKEDIKRMISEAMNEREIHEITGQENKFGILNRKEDIREIVIEVLNETEIQRNQEIQSDYLKHKNEIQNMIAEKMNETSMNQEKEYMKHKENIQQIMFAAKNETEIQKNKNKEKEVAFAKFTENIKESVAKMMNMTDQISNQEKGFNISKYGEDIKKIVVEVMIERERNLKISQARRKLKEMKCLNEVPKKLMNKWKPDSSKFEGVDEYLDKSGNKNKVMQEYLYKSLPIFEWDNTIKNKITLQFFIYNSNFAKTSLTGNCNYKNDQYNKQCIINEGNLHISEFFSSGDIFYRVTRVFYIPDAELEHAFI